MRCNSRGLEQVPTAEAGCGRQVGIGPSGLGRLAPGGGPTRAGPDARSGSSRVVTEPDHGGVQVQDQLASLADRGAAITRRLANSGRHRSAQVHRRANPKAELEDPDGRERLFARCGSLFARR
jgi:hypothetical protein